MTFPFWPFRKPKTKLEFLQDAASDLFSGAASSVQHKLDALPLDRVADSLKHTRENVLETLGHATSGAATALSSTASSATSQTKNLASNLAESAAVKGAVKGAVAKIADAKEFWHDKTDDWKDNAQSASQDARETAKSAFYSASQTAHERASDLADKTRTTAKIARAQAQEKLESAPHAAAQSLKAVQQQAHEKTQATRENAAELAALAAAAFVEWKNQTSKKARRQAEIVYTKAHKVAEDAAQHAQQNAQEFGNAAHHFAAKSSTRFDDTTKKARDAKAHFSEKTADFENDAVRFAPQVHEVHVEDATSKWLWIAVGALVGAALMLFLAPNNGRRSRALAQDKLRKAAHRATKLRIEASSKAADLRNQAEGKLHEAQSAESKDFADDITIADRVRTALGEAEATRNLERINVDCADGIVTLRGPMIDEELKAQIEILVRAVKGVRAVRSQFLIDDSANDNSSNEVFVG